MRLRISLLLAALLALVPVSYAQRSGPGRGSGAMSRVGQVTISGSSTGAVTFSSLPQGYTSLLLVGYGRTLVGQVQTNLALTFNGDTTSTYDTSFINGGNSAVAAGGGTGTAAGSITVTALAGANAAANQAGSFQVFIPSYANTTFFKNTHNGPGLWPNSATVGLNNANVAVGTWRNTAAITSVTVTCPGGNFASGTTFTLYGLQ